MRLVFLLLLSFQSVANNIDKRPHYIFLTTPAETQHKKIDPPLSQCGRLRAQHLSTLLSYSNIQSVYSTTNLSAMETANPIAKKNKIPVKIFIDNLLDSLAITVIKEDKNVLIVANNDKIRFLVEFISQQELSKSQEHNQHLLYQITLLDGHKILTVLKQPLKC
ncbi:histidine phosphatase family protein [Pseudocolwellia agarivorans]|uniref:histidine phosphatase family protein n=1 Tax=Pseudocolwellia agarivorans TaxID=1911682 RepID=UPI0009850514|nr:histidine phosphatase family protein [Pseudocolwellia agarivorans]